MDIEGERIIVGTNVLGDEGLNNETGGAYVFDLSVNQLLRLTPDLATNLSDSGAYSVALSNNTALVGVSQAGDRGEAYLMSLTDGTELQKFELQAPYNAGLGGAEFGTSVDLDQFGAVIGAPNAIDPGTLRDTGAAFAFPTGAGGPATVFKGPSNGLEDAEGTSVAVSGDFVLVGAPGATGARSETGLAYLYRRSDGTLLQTFDSPNLETGDEFGLSVAIDGETVPVAADNRKVYQYRTDGTFVRTLSATGHGDLPGQIIAISGDLGVIAKRVSGASVAALFDLSTGAQLGTLEVSDASNLGSSAGSVAVDGAHVVVGDPFARSAAIEGGEAYYFDLTPRWKTPFGGDYDTASNWDGLAPGTIGFDVEINPDSTQTITGPAGISEVGGLERGGGAGVATLDLQVGGGIIATDPVDIRANGVLQGSGGMIAPAVFNAGKIDLTGLLLTADIINTGLVTGSGSVVGPVENAGNGEIFAGPDESMVFKNAVTNTATIQGRDTSIRFDGGLANLSGGTVRFTTGASDIFGDIQNAQGASIINSGDGTLTLYDAVFNAGEMRSSGSGSTVLFGDYSGPGSFTGGGGVFFEGNVSTGASPSLIGFGGNVSLTNAGTTLMELAGTARGTEYDAWDVAGILDLGGTLNLVGIDGFFPQKGDSFTLFEAGGGITGLFDNVTLEPLSAGLRWNEVRTANSYGYEVSAIPLPAGAWLLIGGLGALALRRRARAA